MASDNGSIFVYDDGINIAELFKASLNVLELRVRWLQLFSRVVVRREDGA